MGLGTARLRVNTLQPLRNRVTNQRRPDGEDAKRGAKVAAARLRQAFLLR
jgi:hypothetical protein